jgi:hypothetical protein
LDRARDVPKKQAYEVLAALVAELLDVRCAGIYLPKENHFTIRVTDRQQNTSGGFASENHAFTCFA